MAIRRTAKNAARAMKYTAMEALTDLAPTSIDIFRQARSGVEDTRNYMRSNMSKIKTHSKTALDSGTLGASFRHYLNDSVGEIRKGNLAIQDITKGLEDDFDRIMAEIKTEAPSTDVGISDSENAEVRAQHAVSSSDLGVDESIIKMMAATGTGTVEALRQLQGSMTQTQLSAAEYMTNKLSTVLFSQMSMQAKHYGIIENSLSAINKNLEALVSYQSKSQNAYIHANMTFFDEMSGYMSRAEAERKAAQRDAKKAKRRKSDGFLADRGINIRQYKDIVRENFDSSEAGMAFSMLTGIDLDYVIESAMNGINPKKILGKAALGALMPKKVRRSIRRSDNMLATMLKSGMGRLGSYQYDMKNHPILGMLGSIFGIDTRLNRKTQLGKFNHMDRSWNGEAQKALVNVIPKYLAEISAHSKDQADIASMIARQMGYDHRRTSASYYDMETGTYQTKAQARANLQKKVRDAKENPFANIFNGASFDPDEILDRDLWKGMSSAIQDQISALMSTAVDSVNGMTAEMNQQLQDLLAKGLKRDKKDINVDRMMAKLVQSVQQSRQNMFDLIQQLQSGESAFAQIAPEIANQWGTIEYEDLMKFLGANSKNKATRAKTSIDLRRANSGAYSIKGRNYEFMGEAAKARAKGASDLVREFMAQVENLPNSRNPAARKAGQLLQLMIYGRGRSQWANTASSAIDRGTTELFDLMMGTGKHAGRGPRSGSGGRLPNIDDGIQNLSDLADIAGAMGADVANAAAGKMRAGKYRVKRAASGAAGAVRGVIGAGLNRVGAGSTSATINAERSEDRDEKNLGSGSSKGGKRRGIINRSYTESSQGGPDDAKTTADATSQMRDTIEDTFGKKGYMAKIYNSPLVKKLIKWLMKTQTGQKVIAGAKSLRDYAGSLFMEDYVDPETGEVVESFKTKMKKMASPVTAKVKGYLGMQDAAETAASDLVEEGEKLKEGMEATREAMVGSEDPKKQQQTITQALGAKFRKSGTKIARGMGIGAGISILAGGKMGLLGSMFLPGGPVGMAILGGALSYAWSSEAFQKVVFGEDDGNGNKTGGLISDKLQKSFKKNLPTFMKGAGAGIAIKLVTGMLGTHGPLSVATGALPAMFGPGGIMGAALIGSAGAFMLKNEKVQDILFGEMGEDGKRTGTMLSGLYNKFGTKIRDGLAGTANNPGLMKKLKAVGIGAAGGAVMSHMGLLGSALSFGGPIGGAIVGSAMGMAAMTPKFQRWIFGDEDPDDPTKRKKNGLLARVSNALDLHIIEPMSNWLSETGQEFALFVREKFETPFRIMLSPLKDLAEQVKDSAVSTVEGVINFVGEKVTGIAQKVLEGVGGKFITKILLPMGKTGASLLKTGIFASMHLAAAPLNLLAGGFETLSKTGRKARRGIKNYTSWSTIGDIVGNRKAAAEARGEKYSIANRLSDTVGAGLAKTPFLRALVRNTDLMKGSGGIMEGARDLSTGSTREILDAKINQYGLHNQRMDVKAEARERKKRDKQRRKMAKSLNYTRGADMTEDEFAKMAKTAKDLGYDVSSRDELDDFIFDINGFKQKKAQKEARAAGKLNDIEDNNMAELDAHQKSRHDEMMDVMKQIAQNTAASADVGKAQLDLDSGTIMDTGDSTFKTAGANSGGKAGGNVDKYSEHVDERVTKKVIAERKATTQAAFTEALGAMKEDEENKVRLADLRGNTTGAGDDEDTKHVGWKEFKPAEKGKSLFDIVSNIFNNGGGGGLGDLLTGAGIAALVAALLGNKDFRDMLLKFFTDTAEEAVTTTAKGAFDFALHLPENLGKIFNTALGRDGGVNNSRTLSYDEDGNPVEVVENEDLKKHLWQAASHPLKTLKAIPKVFGAIPKVVTAPIKGLKAVGHTVLHPIQTAKNAAEAIKNIGTKKAAQTAANSVDNLVNAGLNSSDDAFKVIAQGAAKSTDDIIQAGLNSSDDAVRAAANAAKAASENKGLLSKAINFVKGLLEKAATGNKTFMKLAGTASKVKSGLKGLLTACDDIINKIVTKGLKAAHCEMLAASYAEATGTAAAGAATLGALNVALTLAGGIDGLLSAAHLFKVDPNYTTTKMKLISTVWGAACGGTGIACVVAVLNDIVREFTGFDFVCLCADFLYDLIATDKEEEVRDFGRQYLGTQKDVFNQVNGTELSDQAYNDVRNRSWTTDVWNSITGQVSADKLRSTGAAIEIERQQPTTEAERNKIIEEETNLYDVKKNAILWAKQYKQRDTDSIAQNYGVYYEDNSPEMALANKILANLDTKGVDIQSAEVKQYEKYKTTKPTAEELKMLGLDSTGGNSGTTKKVWSRQSVLPVYAINDNTATQVGKYTISNTSSKSFTVRTDNPVVVGGETYYKLPDKDTKGYTPTVDKASPYYTKDPTGFYIRSSSVTDTKPAATTGRAAHESGKTSNNNRSGNRGRGRGGQSRGGIPVGFGETLTQNDPKWADFRIGTLPSGAPSTMADGGCGPTALANAARTLGSASDPTNIARYAADNGMIAEGGATADLFDKGAKAFGLNSSRVNGSRGIAESLRNGNPVVLSGKGSGSDTPFTDVGHIVTATGMDNKGNVTIQDPQRKGQYKYKLSNIQSKMTGGWAISKPGKKKAAGYGLIDDMFKGFTQLVDWVYQRLGVQRTDENGNPVDSNGSISDIMKDIGSGVTNGISSWASSSWSGSPMDPSESKGRIWNYLRTKVGMSEEAASGMMGCWEAESTNRADRLEGDFLQKRVSGWPTPTQAMSSNAALNEYFTKWLAPRTKGIHPEAYKGTDGNYYPGLGLAQWTGPRGENLLNFSKGLGMDWRDLYAQLNFAMSEFQSRKNSSKIFEATSPSDGAYRALAYYEMSETWARKHPDKLKNRQDYAEAIYATYKGTLGIGQVPDRADATFKPDSSIVAQGIYSMAKGKNVVNGKGENVMTAMEDCKIATTGGVTINDKKYAVVTDSNGYFEPTSRRRASSKNKTSPVGYYVLFSDLVLDRALTATALQNKGAQENSAYHSTQKTAVTLKVPGGVGKGSGKAVGYGLFDQFSDGMNQLADVAYKHLGLPTVSQNQNQSSADGTSGYSYNPQTGQYESADGSALSDEELAKLANMPASSGQKKVVAQMASIIGKLRYSLSGGQQNPDKGVASCASTVGWAYNKALGVKNMSASSTAQCKHPDFETIWTNKGKPLDPRILQPGDILYQNWDRTSNNGKMKHTEMYAGNNRDLSHGGPGAGPQYKDLNEYRRKHTMMVRRYKPFMNQSPQTASDTPTGKETSAYYSSKTKTTPPGTGAVGYGLFDSLSSGFEELTKVAYRHFGVDYPSADGTSNTDSGTTDYTHFFQNMGTSADGTPVTDAMDDSSIYGGGSIATGKGFVPRLSRPTAGNKYYIRKNEGGYSDACLGKPTDPQNNVLHNCVGYAFGRFNEIVGDGACNLLRPVDAENFMDYKGSLETGQMPRVGAVAVWSKGRKGNHADGAGHVAIVEKVNGPDSIVTSESGWEAKKPFWTEARTRGDGNWGKKSPYSFQGFIYNPAPSCQPNDKDNQAEVEASTDPGAKYRDGSAYWSSQKKPAGMGAGKKRKPISSIGEKHPTREPKLGAFGAIFDRKNSIKSGPLMGQDPKAGIGSGDGESMGSLASVSHTGVDHGIPYGYGAGGDIHSNANGGIETRLDQIIVILDRIAKNGEKKVAPVSNTVNNTAIGFGKGGEDKVQPIIVKEQKQPGEKDALHQYGRSMHRRIAAKERFI